MVPLSILSQNGPTVAPYVLSCRKLCFSFTTHCGGTVQSEATIPPYSSALFLVGRENGSLQVCLNASQHKILCSANWNPFPPPCIARSRCTSCSSLQLHLRKLIGGAVVVPPADCPPLSCRGLQQDPVC